MRLLRPTRELPQQGGLPRAGFTGDERHLSGARQSATQESTQLLQLAFASDEQCRFCHHEPRWGGEWRRTCVIGSETARGLEVQRIWPSLPPAPARHRNLPRDDESCEEGETAPVGLIGVAAIGKPVIWGPTLDLRGPVSKPIGRSTGAAPRAGASAGSGPLALDSMKIRGNGMALRCALTPWALRARTPAYGCEAYADQLLAFCPRPIIGGGPFESRSDGRRPSHKARGAVSDSVGPRPPAHLGKL
jgi:hypothetical protein